MSLNSLIFFQNWGLLNNKRHTTRAGKISLSFGLFQKCKPFYDGVKSYKSDSREVGTHDTSRKAEPKMKEIVKWRGDFIKMPYWLGFRLSAENRIRG